MAAPSITVQDKWITVSNNNELFTKTWKPAGKPVAHVILIHGFGEHIARYDHVATLFAQNGIQVYGFDQRGWGQTGKKSKQYGNNQGYNTALSDINEAVHAVHESGVPLFLIGHSMGGGLALNYLAKKEQFDGVKLVRGAIASAPLITLTLPISPLRYYPLMLVSRILPSWVIQAGLDPKGISHDEQEVQKYVDDPLIHDYATLSTSKLLRFQRLAFAKHFAKVRGFLDAGYSLLTEGKAIETPVLFSHGDADPLNSYHSTAKVYEIASSTDKSLRTFPGLYHELHNETRDERNKVLESYLEWIKARIP
ncbi:hypothetical protein DFQ28_001730 [Apophysomyces sp. BC1034]|nr:hypothetical protein DFQ30_002428 [Apophysomyces sp. BC1015]KAG0180559.1 hypothetical protein DFQ29_000412 [Apophysomyces sp. BC1021]KAG0190670.1 hypothetical protein DFQ28_001730 [Apophysomyces sp. BC1034]